MIATLGCFKVLLDQPTADPYTLNIAPELKHVSQHGLGIPCNRHKTRHVAYCLPAA